MTNPTGPRTQLPKEIYVRRRVAALVALLVVVVALIVAATVAFGGNDEATPAAQNSTAPARGSEAAPASEAAASATAEVASSATETAAADPSSQPTEAPPESASADPSAAPESEAAEPSRVVDPTKTTCAIQDLQVFGKTSQPVYEPGQMPTFYLEVFNPTTVDCQINLNDEKMRFEVYRMGSNVKMWTDTDCYPSVQTGMQTFKSGQSRIFQADWSRRASAEGQCTDRPDVEPGNYMMFTVIGENNSEAVPFNLH